MRLLLIEEDEMIGEPIVETMRGAGYLIDWARHAPEANLLLDHAGIPFGMKQYDDSARRV